MSSTPSVDDRSARVLVHAPFGRDGALLCQVLQRAGIDAETCPRIEGVYAGCREGVAAILVGDEALTAAAVERLRCVLSEQPPWSDLPVFVMTRPMEKGTRHSFLKRLNGLGNISLLDRPLRSETIASTFQMALRARARQYDIRDHLEAARRSAATLAQANEELRRVNEDLNQFAYSASHDLQEPLRMVTVYTQLLERNFGAELGEKASEYMRFAVQGAKRMEELLKDLLSYVQVANGAEGEVRLIDTNQVVLQAIQNLQSAIDESGAKIEAGVLPMLLAKPVHVLQLLQNLIGNALKYRGEAPPEISVSAKHINAEWQFTVRDNGIGVESRFAQLIFGVLSGFTAEIRSTPGRALGSLFAKRSWSAMAVGSGSNPRVVGRAPRSVSLFPGQRAARCNCARPDGGGRHYMRLRKRF